MSVSQNPYTVVNGNQLERRRRRWEDNIKMCRKEIGYEFGNWIHLSPVAGSCELSKMLNDY